MFDLESADSLSSLTAMARNHAPKEALAELGRLRSEHFTQIWTMKEAYIKATGQGLALPLNSFAVSYTDSAPEVLRSAVGAVSDWTISCWAPAAGYRAAVAVHRADARVHHFSFVEEDDPAVSGSLLRKPHPVRP
ncbi:4'-phosphopantetheinyl transferase superfamily protein [Phaeobacter piscinae]|uniref:4'-phosphopantetheinyl transferase superfamily protein n=1 Tax=Phaeobacter piscinae TaxID=1580596 RepID=UPI000BBE6D38|nr:4'-phosphopantetheinyl transferase superfamily protein [Phaeobacter piscinae]ATG39393.1 4'-phosphopantetheinyl transferase-like protein [Phaeobacter piscinae]